MSHDPITAGRPRALALGACMALALALLLPASGALAQDASPAPSVAPEEPSYLFVMSAPSGSVDAETLTLRGVPAVTWFTDRPYRQAGQISPATFEGFWPELVAAFDGVAPNAVLSVLGDDAVTNTVIRLVGVDSVTRDASGTADDIVLRYTVVEGAMPTGEIGAASLFVDEVHPTHWVTLYLNDCYDVLVPTAAAPAPM
ncbi:MAG: hypothetical protein ACKOTZ_05500 [Chloroflexota bacterium]